MKYQILLKNEITNKLEKNDIIEASNNKEAKELANNLYPHNIIELRQIVKLCCYHINKDKTLCNYSWSYKGARTTSATCPNCHKQVYIHKAIK